MAYCRRRLRDAEEAEDATQATFLKAFGALGRGVEPLDETAWLFGIARNVVIERVETRGRLRSVELGEEPLTLDARPATPDNRPEALLGLRPALRRLAPQPQRALLLREWQGLTYDEIADDLEIEAASVGTLLMRARRDLAEQLEPTQRKLRQVPKRLLAWLPDVLRRSIEMLSSGGAHVVAGVAVAAVPIVVPIAAPGSISPDAPRVLHVAGTLRPPPKVAGVAAARSADPEASPDANAAVPIPVAADQTGTFLAAAAATPDAGALTPSADDGTAATSDDGPPSPAPVTPDSGGDEKPEAPPVRVDHGEAEEGEAPAEDEASGSEHRKNDPNVPEPTRRMSGLENGEGDGPPAAAQAREHAAVLAALIPADTTTEAGHQQAAEHGTPTLPEHANPNAAGHWTAEEPPLPTAAAQPSAAAANEHSAAEEHAAAAPAAAPAEDSPPAAAEHPLPGAAAAAHGSPTVSTTGAATPAQTPQATESAGNAAVTPAAPAAGPVSIVEVPAGATAASAPVTPAAAHNDKAHNEVAQAASPAAPAKKNK
jgi:RNA polymerase sigma factor (sigma-70 family)